MKGELNVMAPYSREILFAPSLHGFKKGGRFGNKKGAAIKDESRSSEREREREREKKRERETKHINRGIGGLTAHILFFFSFPFLSFFFFLSFYPREKTTAAMNVFPMNLQLQA